MLNEDRFAAEADVRRQNARVIHVSPNGSDEAPGTPGAPLRTISKAAFLAQPGDSIEVADGIYRERVNPPRGGLSDACRIVYSAAADARPVICGSEIIDGWRQVDGTIWQATIPNTLFGDFNPFATLVEGDWFNGRGRQFSAGCVYVDGAALTEAPNREALGQAIRARPMWFAEVRKDETILWAQFAGAPADATVEVTVRQTVFYPSANHIDFITVRGFELRHGATPWAPPTAEQIGLIGTNWSKGWVIEDNHVHHSRCSGIALGKHGDEYDNKSANTAEGYVATIERAHDRGWTKDRIGHHIVRRNLVSHCGQAGIVGSMGCAFSSVTDNVVHDIHLMEHFSGAEEAGIKFHGAVDTDISRNHVYRARRGIWLDWMAQGARVVGNLLHDNASEDVYLEVNHGPCLIANNLLLSHRSLKIESTGGAFVHNLITGLLAQAGGHGRHTPYLAPHSTELTRLGPVAIGDDRWFNNLIIGPADMLPYDWATATTIAEDNIYGPLAIPPNQEDTPFLLTDIGTAPKLIEESDGWYLELGLPDGAFAPVTGKLVTSERLGRISQPRFGGGALPAPAFERPDGAPYIINWDYYENPRPASSPGVGPFAGYAGGPLRTKVWPIPEA